MYDPAPAHCRLIADHNDDPCNLISGMVFEVPCTPRHPAAFPCNNPPASKSRAHDIFLSILPDTCTSRCSRLSGWRQRWCYSSDSRGFALVAAVAVGSGQRPAPASIRSRASLTNPHQFEAAILNRTDNRQSRLALLSLA
jgi:hypothetical protein